MRGPLLRSHHRRPTFRSEMGALLHIRPFVGAYARVCASFKVRLCHTSRNATLASSGQE